MIRLHRQQLDSFRQELGQWQERRARFVRASEMLTEQLEKELSVADSYPEMKGFFGQFSKRIEEQQNSIRQQILRVDRQIGLLQEEIFKAFGDMKKYEIARDIQIEQQRQHQQRQEQLLLDEVGSQLYARQDES